MANEDGAAGRVVTISDVARRAGVAISSVSSAINGRPGVSEETRARIQQAARDLGFVPSLRGKSLSAKRAFAVGLVIRRDPEVLEADPFFGGFIAGIESVLSQRGYALVLQMSTSADDDVERYRQLALHRRVDGIYLNELTVDDARLPLVRSLGVPAVAISEARIDWSPTVLQDASGAIQALVDRLIELGHRRFAHVSGPTRYLHANRRRDMWLTALAARGGIEIATVIESDFTYAGGARAASALLSSPVAERPTAVFCANDLMAAGFMAAAQDLGIAIPGELSVAGFDGTDLGTYVRPTLTTVATSPHELGRTSTELLLAAVDGDRHDIELSTRPPRLIVRDSIGLAPHR